MIALLLVQSLELQYKMYLLISLKWADYHYQ